MGAVAAVAAGALAWGGAASSALPAALNVHTSAAKPPVLGHTVLVAAVSGSVSVRVVGTHVFLSLKAPLDLPVGSEIDTRQGSISVTEATGVTGTVEAATVEGGRAIVTQQAATAAPATFRLSQPLACSKTAGAGVKHTATRRHIRVRETGGNWDTRAQYVATAAEGTDWTTTDTCGSSTVTVRSGRVSATNLINHKTVTLTAGEHLTVTSASRMPAVSLSTLPAFDLTPTQQAQLAVAATTPTGTNTTDASQLNADATLKAAYTADGYVGGHERDYTSLAVSDPSTPDSWPAGATGLYFVGFDLFKTVADATSAAQASRADDASNNLTPLTGSPLGLGETVFQTVPAGSDVLSTIVVLQRGAVVVKIASACRGCTEGTLPDVVGVFAKTQLAQAEAQGLPPK